MSSLRFAPYREIAQEVAARLAASRDGVDPLAPWAEDAIVPSRGMAEAIAEELLARMPQGFAGLQLVTLDELARRKLSAAGTTPRVASEVERRLAMRTATRLTDHEIMTSRGVASMLERAYRDVRDSGVTLAELGRRVRNARGLRHRGRTEAILRAWTTYERLIAQLGAIDPADVLGEAAQRVEGMTQALPRDGADRVIPSEVEGPPADGAGSRLHEGGPSTSLGMTRAAGHRVIPRERAESPSRGAGSRQHQGDPARTRGMTRGEVFREPANAVIASEVEGPPADGAGSRQYEGDPSTSLGMTRDGGHGVIPRERAESPSRGAGSRQHQGDPALTRGMTRGEVFREPANAVIPSEVEGPPADGAGSRLHEGGPSTSLGMTRDGGHGVIPRERAESHAGGAGSRQHEGDPALTLGMTRRFLLAGFYDMTGAQFALVEALLRAGRIGGVWIPSEEAFAQPFAKALAPWVEVVRDPVIEIRRPEVAAVQYDTRFDELRDVCARVAALLRDGVPPREIGIVARSFEPYDVRLLNRFAAEHGFGITTNDELPLHAHRIGRGAIALLRLRERGFLRADVLELVRDGLLVRTPIDANEADAATRRARIAGGTSEELRAIRNRSCILDDYIALVCELEELTATIDLAKLSSLFRIETRHDLEAVETLDQIAAVFERARVWNSGIDVAAFIDAIEHESLAPRTSNLEPRIWCGELLRFRGRSFAHLFAVRMQDDVFPQRRTEDPLLPDSDRRMLGVREIGDGRDEERLLFSLVNEAAAHVRFSFASGDGFGKVLRKSRFLGVRQQSCRFESGGSRRRTPRQLQLLAKAGTSSIFDGHIGPIVQLPEALSPTQLEDFGECPQKFLIKHLLGATDIDQPERELQIHPREKGTLDHRILERFYRGIGENDIAEAAASLPKLPERIAIRLDETIDAEFDRLERDAPPFNRTVRDIERRATKRILREFIAADLADLAAQELVPRWFEYRFGRKHRDEADRPDPFVVEAGGVPVRVEGTIDRIDAGAGRFRIVDYKSGKAGRHQNLAEKIDRGVRLQLALYAMAVADFFDAPADRVSATIKPLVLGDVKPEKFAFALQEKRETLLDTLEIFMRAIQQGAFPAFPNENDLEFNSCKYCPVNHSCRTRHDAAERYAVARHKDPRTLLGGEGG